MVLCIVFSTKLYTKLYPSFMHYKSDSFVWLLDSYIFQDFPLCTVLQTCCDTFFTQSCQFLSGLYLECDNFSALCPLLSKHSWPRAHLPNQLPLVYTAVPQLILHTACSLADCFKTPVRSCHAPDPPAMPYSTKWSWKFSSNFQPNSE